MKLMVSLCKPLGRKIGKMGKEPHYLCRGEALSGPDRPPLPGTLNVVSVKQNTQTGMIYICEHTIC